MDCVDWLTEEDTGTPDADRATTGLSDRASVSPSVSPCSRVSVQFPELGYCFAGGGGGAVFGLRLVLCFRVPFIPFIAAPPVVNETISGSPGTLVKVKVSPTFLARSDIALCGGGGFGPGIGGVRSPIITVTAV